MKKSILLFTLLCTSLFAITKNVKPKEKDKITAIKFMYSVSDYSIAIYEKSFWKYPEEHAKLEIAIDDFGNFLEEVKKLPTTKGETFGYFKYAFILDVKGKKDTIYADSSLKTFRKVYSNGSGIDYYDEDGFYAEDLRHEFSFFKDCW